MLACVQYALGLQIKDHYLSSMQFCFQIFLSEKYYVFCALQEMWFDIIC